MVEATFPIFLFKLLGQDLQLFSIHNIRPNVGAHTSKTEVKCYSHELSDKWKVMDKLLLSCIGEKDIHILLMPKARVLEGQN